MAAEMPLADANIETLTSRFGVAPLAVVPAGALQEPVRRFGGRTAQLGGRGRK